MFGLSLATIRLIAYGVIAAIVLGLVAYVKHEWDAGKAAQAQVHVIKAQDKAVSAAVVKVDRQAAGTEKQAQARIKATTRTIYKEITRYVPKPVPGKPTPCISWGLVRLHDAAVLGVDPATLPSPAGQPDDACSTVTAADLAGRLVLNYGNARANAEQLDALEAAERAREAAATAATRAPPSP